MGGAALHRRTDRLGLGFCLAWLLLGVSYMASHAGATGTRGTSRHQRGKGESRAPGMPPGHTPEEDARVLDAGLLQSVETT